MNVYDVKRQPQADLRIYYGDARIIVKAGDERIAMILALVHDTLAPPSAGPPIREPRTDSEFLDLADRFFLRRRR